jgi:lipopolysaccharide export system permease protein
MLLSLATGIFYFTWAVTGVSLSIGLSILLLVLLGLPLAKSDPREPRYARLLIAVLVYLVYANCLAIGRNAIGQERIAALPGLWWVYVPTFAIALWLIWRSQQLRAPRVARGVG